jgi:hypothetical protein
MLLRGGESTTSTGTPCYSELLTSINTWRIFRSKQQPHVRAADNAFASGSEQQQLTRVILLLAAWRLHAAAQLLIIVAITPACRCHAVLS